MARAAIYSLTVLLAVLFVIPLVWMFVVSFKPEGVSAITIKEWVDFSDLTIRNYEKVLTESQILKWTSNSLVIGAITTVITVAISSLAAFAFSRKSFKTKGFWFILCASGLLIPTEAMLIPLYETVLKLELLDTKWGIILPSLTNPLGLILIKQFMDGLPKDYMEAAQIDGCKDFRMWRSIYMPLTRSAMVSIGIFYFIMSWNNFIWPYIAINSEDNMVLATGLPTFLANNVLHVNTIMTASAIAAIPTMVVYIFLQKHIVQGVSMTGVKG
ncbi:carbohydrate ABC transporter permease [Paenibacillus sp. CECT 9249]|uniref:carbohydrate ABC transporter permease n=1 Tax=unclassified Paenibacillus TaxID=185978 RepID=UPI001E390042|nr:carbohydrate ABC transporter permease [Paenibacillus sp. CECT 9249]CAH0117661.1 L-arabinose transport system permease protein AraQ [Paenibacillus sp. CECT 9249]